MSTVVTKLKRALKLDTETVTNTGHECWRLSESMDRNMSLLDSRPVTWGDLLTGRVRADLGLERAAEVLSQADELLQAGDVQFQMMNDMHSLQAWRDSLAGSIARAKTYRGAA